MKKTRILVVDDELSMIKFLRASLEANGFEVLAAIDGREALQEYDQKQAAQAIHGGIAPPRPRRGHRKRQSR